MFWADQYAQDLKKRKLVLEWVDDMKTPSGRVHVGALRGVILHDLIFKTLAQAGVNSIYSYVINDMDPMDSLPIYLPEGFTQYMGKPLYKIPSPGKDFDSYAQYYAQEFISVFNRLNCHPKIIWSHELYESGKMDKVVRECLDKTEEIKAIYEGTHKKDLGVWSPFQVICPKCGKLGSTKVTGWDGENVSFSCLPDKVAWAVGCGYSGKISPFGGSGKLLWKIDWAAHWKTLGVTCEWAGKDHMTKGGSYEITAKICQDVLGYRPPDARLYEHLLLGGRKMSSSKGIGASAIEIAKILPPEVLRFLMVRVHYKTAINFDPSGNTIPDLFDEYDEFANYYYEFGVKSDYGRIWQLSQVAKIPEQKPLFPRFRDIANFIQSPSIDIYKKFEKVDKKILEERIKYAKIWLKTYAPEDIKFEVKDSNVEIDNEQKKYLHELIKLVGDRDWEPEKLQQEMYELSKKMGIQPKKAFQSIYLTLFGKTFGPKAAWLILENKKKVLKRLGEAVKL